MRLDRSATCSLALATSLAAMAALPACAPAATAVPSLAPPQSVELPPARAPEPVAAPAAPPPPAPEAEEGSAKLDEDEPAAPLGALKGAAIGDAFGAGGLGLSGSGGGGGGIGIGSVGTRGTGGGSVGGYGRGGGATTPPSLRQGATQVIGRLPPEVIQRISRQNFGRYRHCYELALRSNPNLSGRVSVKFVIGPDGAVKSATAGPSDIPDQAMIKCVVAAFATLTFPKPDGGGQVVVQYPVVFSPGDASPSAAPAAPAPKPATPAPAKK